MNVWGAHVRPPTFDRAVAAWMLARGLMGSTERQFFERAVASGQTVVDVGANQGIFTLLFSRLVGAGGRVFAFEPAPALFAALDANCRANNAGNVTRFQLAVGAEHGKAVLNCNWFNGGDNRLTGSRFGSSVPVNVVSLDEMLPVETVDWIKIDVQGFERQVVEGMQGILERNPAVRVFFEFWPLGLRRAQCDPRDLLDFFLARLHFERTIRRSASEAQP